MKKRLLTIFLPIFLLVVIGVGTYLFIKTRLQPLAKPLFSEGLVVVEKDGKYGYVNTSGKIIIPLQYDYAENFAHGVAVVAISDKYFLINNKGKKVLKEDFTFLQNTPDDKVIIFEKAGKKGLMTPIGKILKEAKYDNIDFFSEGIAAYRDNNKYGYINNKGEVLTPAVYETIRPFAGGVGIAFKQGEVYCINKEGKAFHQGKYLDIYGFYEGTAIVEKMGKDKFVYGILSDKGEIIHDGYESITRSKNCYVIKKDGKFSILTKNKKEIPLSKDYDRVIGVQPQLSVYMEYFYGLVESDSGVARMDVINEKGEVVLVLDSHMLGQNYAIFDFASGDLYSVKHVGKTTHMKDLDGNGFEYEYQTEAKGDAITTLNNFFVLQSEKYHGVVDQNGKVILDFQYDWIWLFTDGYAVVKKDHKFGIFDLKGNMILPVEYQSILVQDFFSK